MTGKFPEPEVEGGRLSGPPKGGGPFRRAPLASLWSQETPLADEPGYVKLMDTDQEVTPPRAAMCSRPWPSERSRLIWPRPQHTPHPHPHQTSLTDCVPRASIRLRGTRRPPGHSFQIMLRGRGRR